MKKILMIVAIFFVVTLTVGEIYRTDVDTTYGFYQVRNDNNPDDNFKYLNHTLNINVGDTVTWRSMDDFKITVVNEQNLWGNTSGILSRSFKEFNYTFNNAGTYRVHLIRYQRLHQTIVVGYTTNIDPKNLVLNPTLVTTTPVPTTNVQNTTEMVKITEVPKPISQYQTNDAPKNTPGFELIFGILGFILLSRKYD